MSTSERPPKPDTSDKSDKSGPAAARPDAPAAGRASGPPPLPSSVRPLRDAGKISAAHAVGQAGAAPAARGGVGVSGAAAKKVFVPRPAAPRALGGLLQKSAQLSEAVLLEALADQEELRRGGGATTEGTRLGELLVKRHAVTEEQVLQALGLQFDLPVALELKPETVEPDLAQRVPINFAKQHRLLLLRRQPEHAGCSWFDLLLKSELLAPDLQAMGPVLIQYQGWVQRLPPHDALHAIYEHGDVLARFAALLNDHVRFEERELFEAAQRLLYPEH